MLESLQQLSALADIPIWLIVIATLWSLVWKGLALWKSSQRKKPIWFVVLLVVNTLGILEILYIYVFSEIKLDKKPVKKINPTKRKAKPRKK